MISFQLNPNTVLNRNTSIGFQLLRFHCTKFDSYVGKRFGKYAPRARTIPWIFIVSLKIRTFCNSNPSFFQLYNRESIKNEGRLQSDVDDDVRKEMWQFWYVRFTKDAYLMLRREGRRLIVGGCWWWWRWCSLMHRETEGFLAARSAFVFDDDLVMVCVEFWWMVLIMIFF